MTSVPSTVKATTGIRQPGSIPPGLSLRPWLDLQPHLITPSMEWPPCQRLRAPLIRINASVDLEFSVSASSRVVMGTPRRVVVSHRFHQSTVDGRAHRYPSDTTDGQRAVI